MFVSCNGIILKVSIITKKRQNLFDEETSSLPVLMYIVNCNIIAAVKNFLNSISTHNWFSILINNFLNTARLRSFSIVWSNFLRTQTMFKIRNGIKNIRPMKWFLRNILSLYFLQSTYCSQCTQWCRHSFNFLSSFFYYVVHIMNFFRNVNEISILLSGTGTGNTFDIMNEQAQVQNSV